MDFGFVDSPSTSPDQSIFTTTQYFDSTSESSSPNSPRQLNQMMFNSGQRQFDMYQFGTTSVNYYPSQQNKISIDYAGSTNLDEGDRRKRRSTSSSKPEDTDGTPNMHLRRRAQNRASQRAFRERKEKHVKGLEHQLEELHEKHQDLVQSYNRQANEVSKLSSRIGELTSELNALRACQNQDFGDLMLPGKFDKFDAFSSHDLTGGAYGAGDGHDQGRGYYGKSHGGMHEQFALQSFEDSL